MRTGLRLMGVLVVGTCLLAAEGCSGRKVSTSTGDQASVAPVAQPAPQEAQSTPEVDQPPVPPAPEPAMAEPPTTAAEPERSLDAPPPPPTSPSTMATEASEPPQAPIPEEIRETEPASPAPQPGGSTPAVPVPAEASPAPAQPVPEPARLTLADVYFDFDRFALGSEAKEVLESNAQLLKSQNGWRLFIEGHCDERGTAAYNMVLGERRAQAVLDYLIALGVPAAQVQIASYGKERPFCTEHSDPCWQRNRRAHFVLKP